MTLNRNLLGFGIFALVLLMLWSAVDEPGIKDLEVDFKEVHFARNENNTGPVVRRYLVTVSDTLWSDLERYGDLMPYTKLGATEVLFFLEGSALPNELQLKGAPFDASFEPLVVATYRKNTMGKKTFKR